MWWRLNVCTYIGRFVAEEERLVGKHVGENFEVVLAEGVNFVGGVHAQAYCFDFLSLLEPLSVNNTLKTNTTHLQTLCYRKTVYNEYNKTTKQPENKMIRQLQRWSSNVQETKLQKFWVFFLSHFSFNFRSTNTYSQV